MVSFPRVPTKEPMAMAQCCLCIRTEHTFLFMEGKTSFQPLLQREEVFPPAGCLPLISLKALTVHDLISELMM
jgi:hypothetical protein